MTSPPSEQKLPRSDSNAQSVTAQDYINAQLQLESDAREVLPYTFDACTHELGRLRQSVYACRTCTPRNPTTPPGFCETKTDGAAALCYACSIKCHGDHELVEIFDKRGTICDCGTKRIPGVQCDLRKCADQDLAEKEGDETRYGQNYWGRFCVCEVDYDPEKENGTMYQCFLGDACGEDWFHDTCIVGQKPPNYDNLVEEKGKGKEVNGTGAAGSIESDGHSAQPPEATADTIMQESTSEVVASGVTNGEAKEVASNSEVEVDGKQAENVAMEGIAQEVKATDDAEVGNRMEEDEDEDEDEKPAGFPKEEFEHFICWACVEKNPWLKRYAGTPGFLPSVYREGTYCRDTNETNKNSNTESTESTEATKDAAAKDAPGPPTENNKVPQEQVGTETVLAADRKRKASEEPETSSKRAKTPDAAASLSTNTSVPSCKLAHLAPPLPSDKHQSLLLQADFRSHLCRCAKCFPLLARHRCLLEEEEAYAPPVDQSDHEGSVHSGSTLLDQGERALGTMPRVKAIEGLMAFKNLSGNLHSFFKPFAESGREVTAEDIKEYFARLRGDKEATNDSGEGVQGDKRQEGEGY